MPEHRSYGPSLSEILERPMEERRALLLNWHPQVKEWADWIETQRVKYKEANPLAYWPPGGECAD